MAPDARLPERSVLQEHTAFLRRLAFSLLHDEHAADDVVQQSFVAALEREERPRNLRAWLAAVARNLSLSALRSRRNRARREQAVARRDRVPPPDEGIARLELQRRVVDAVLALDEPYRSAIVYRFFHELRLKEIAGHLGVPTATVRTRVRRGIEQLRARLDAEHGGQRRAWAVLLLPLLQPPVPPPAPVGAGVVKALVAVAVGALLVGSVWWAGRREPAPAATPVAPPPVVEPDPAQPAPPPAEEPPPPVRTPEGPAPQVPPEDPAEAAPEPLPLIEVREDPPKPPAPRKRTPAPAAGGPPGFVFVPAGPLQPGCTLADFKRRATNQRLAKALVYEVWGADHRVAVPGFFQGRYEVTNAQWKHYLDAEFRARLVTTGGETLAQVAQKLTGRESEWGAIYALNTDTIRAALGGTFPRQDPPESLMREPLPAKLDLVAYRCRVPRPWYGWCRASHLQVGREFVDARKPADAAFRPPADLHLCDDDFAAYPVRDISAAAMFAFAEWAGARLPSEYEFERSVRYDRPNTAQYPFKGAWDRAAHPEFFAWGNNPRCGEGPLRVDDESVAGGDTRFGARHVLGNVWELTRTFFDSHPFVAPAPPPHDLSNYALTAKGGSYGDPWRFLQVSTRTPVVGNAELDLQFANRADSLGFRLVRHAQPGRDLVSHSIRRLVYDVGGADWRRPFPHEFALGRAAGHDVVDWVEADAPYVHVRGPARGIAFAPLWQAGVSSQRLRDLMKDARAYVVLGVLRSDVALRAGVRLTGKEANDLRRARDEYESARRRGKAEGEPPPAPDAYEQATVRREKKIGLWREGTIGPGEWLVVAWQDFVGLMDASRLVPPSAILMVDAPKRARGEAGRAALDLDFERDVAKLRFAVEEPSGERGAKPPPDERRSELWALCEVSPNGWPGRVPGAYAWHWSVELGADLDALR